MEPKKPIAGNWDELQGVTMQIKKQTGCVAARAFVSPLGIRVISSIEMVPDNNGTLRPEYHISLSDNGNRIAASIVPTVLKQFGASIEWDEDNHVAHGKVRNFWCPMNEVPDPCPCKENEKPTIEGDYVWRDE